MDYSALQKISYGVYIVASEYKGEKAGFIANTVFQVTSSPATIAVSCNKNNDSLKHILGSGNLTVSVLEKDTPVSLITAFGYKSGKESDKFTGISFVRKKTGAPVITDHTVSWLDCTVKETVDLGTHVLIICTVEESGLLANELPLTYSYYREKFKSSSPRNAPTYVEKEPVPESEYETTEKKLTETDKEPAYDD